MFIRAGGSLEHPGAIISVAFQPQEQIPLSATIIKCVDARGNVPEIRFQTHTGSAYISGYPVSQDTFHIAFIVNLARKDRRIKGLLDVLHTTFDYLKKSGVKEVTVNCKPHLVPIAIKRYGFTPTKGHSAEEANKGIGLIPLVKKLE